MKAKLIKIKQNDFKVMTIFLLWAILYWLIFMSVLAILIIFFKQDKLILISGTILICTYFLYKFFRMGKMLIIKDKKPEEVLE